MATIKKINIKLPQIYRSAIILILRRKKLSAIGSFTVIIEKPRIFLFHCFTYGKTVSYLNENGDYSFINHVSE